jgi:hypothetical protein
MWLVWLMRPVHEGQADIVKLRDDVWPNSDIVDFGDDHLGCALLQPWEGRMSKSAAEAVQVIQPGKTYIGKQGFSYGAGASTERSGRGRFA